MESVKCCLTSFFNIGERKHAVGQCKARIAEEGSDVCSFENRDNCYDPTSIRSAIKPLAVYAKVFGLFPRYDLSFVSTLEDKKITIIHILDYCYTAFVFCVIASGALMCTLTTPSAFKRTLNEEDKNNVPNQMDFYVSMGVVYMTMGFGVMSLFTFPASNGKLLKLIDHFLRVDQALRFDGRSEERHFAKKMLFHLILILLLTLTAYMGFYILEPSGLGIHICVADYIIVPILTLCGTTQLIPTAIVIFFLHGLRVRLFHFNKHMESKLSTVSPRQSVSSLDTWFLGKSPEREFTKEYPGHELSMQLEKLRLTYSELVTLSCDLSYLFGSHLARDYLFSICGLILYTYLLLYVDYGGSVSNYFIVGILEGFLLLKLFTLSQFAHRIHCFGGEMRRMLHQVSLSKVSSDGVLQLQLFITAVDTCPLNISAAGYFTINRGLLTSILGAFSTYIIILIQFKVGDIRGELKAWAEKCNMSDASVLELLGV